MNHFPEAWGRPRNDVYGAYDHSYLQQSGPIQHTQSPVVTGTSVVAVKFKDGVVIAADNLASYGSLARFTDVKRLRKFNDHSVLGFGGDVSDMQYLDRLLSSLDIRENYSHSSSSESQLDAKNLHTYLSKVMYKRRSDMNPLWNAILVAGMADEVPVEGKEALQQQQQGKPAEEVKKDDPTATKTRKMKPFLAFVDLLGVKYSSPTLATGFGAHLAQPLLRKLVPDEDAVANTSREQAEAAVKEAMKVLFYRDARSMDKYSIAVISQEHGVELRESEQLEQQSWSFAEGIRGYGTQTV